MTGFPMNMEPSDIDLLEFKWFVLVGTLQNGIELLYIHTLPSHQYILECCKNFWTKINHLIYSSCSGTCGNIPSSKVSHLG